IGRDNNLPLVIAKTNLGLGIVADHKADYSTAIDKNLLALKYFETKHDTLGIAAATGNIGNSYIRLAQFQKAVTALARAVDLYTALKSKVPAANNMANLARAYKGLHDKPKELEFKLKAFAIFNAEGYKRGLATVGGTLGNFYAAEDKTDEALKYFNIGLKNSWAIHDNGNIAMLYGSMADLYIRLNQADKAMICADSAIYYSLKSGDKLAQADAELSKGVILHIKGDHAPGAYLINHYMALKDSIFAGKMQTQVADMEVKYETEKKETQIALLNIDNNNKSLLLKNSLLQVTRKQLQITEQRQALTINQLELNNKDTKLINQQLDADKREANIRSLQKQTRIQKLEISNSELKIKQKNYAIAVILVLIAAGVLLGYTFYNRYQSKQVALVQQQKIEQQEHLTQAIIDAEEKERQRIASDLHDGVGQLFSAVKMNLNGLLDRVTINREEDRFLAEKTLALVDESCKEVRVISHQMMPNNMLLRSGIASDVKSFIEKIDSESLKVNVETTGFKNKLESNVEIVLYRVIQETVNNVIKHAKATTLFIKLERKQLGIDAIIADNGIGFNTTLKDDFEGIGLKNITTRIEYLKGTVEYISAPGMGTSVNIWVPIA
ncbi:MAG: sensor histidine kinase, partial [Mucilaginibacter sp.]|nr:sensor histidine kinase [Mucilaginibacter sp.]